MSAIVSSAAKKAAQELLKKVGIPAVGVAFAVTDALMKLIAAEQQKKLDATRKHEGCPHIQACAEISGWVGDGINAMTAAHLGWTAWQTPDGLWVFHHQPDYPPRSARTVCRPQKKEADHIWTWTFEHVRHNTGKVCQKCREAWRGR
jgi:hypothetical protein